MKKLILFLLVAQAAFGAFGAGTVWEVQSSGADTNGGGFDPGVVSPGTDESTGAGTAITITSGGSTGTGSPAFTSTTHGPGNFVHIASGSGCTVGWYEVVSQAAGVATFDSSMGTGTCVGVIGGPLATVVQANTNVVPGNTIWVKATSGYSLSSIIALTAGSGGARVQWLGYTSSRGDGGPAAIIVTASGLSPVIDVPGGVSFSNFTLSSPGQTGTRMLQVESGAYASNISITSFQDLGVYLAGYGFIDNIYVTGGASGCLSGYYMIGGTATNIRASANACPGARIAGTITINRGIFDGQTAGSPGIQVSASSALTNIVAYGNAGAGVSLDTAVFADISNAIMVNNTGAGLASSTTYTSNPGDYNAYYGNNGGGAQLTGWNHGPNDACPSGCAKTITGDPITNAAGGDFSLNNTSGAGALLRASGFPGILLSGGTGHLDIGALQHQDAGGSSATRACSIAQ